MKLEHIALNITDLQEVKEFYQNILGMVEVKNYELDEDLAQHFFSIRKVTPVYLMQRDNLIFELFVNAKSYNHGFNHICLEIKNRETIVSTAVENSYKCIRRKKEYFDQIFISDKSGNIFEIKEVNGINN